MCVGERVGVVTDAVFVSLLPFPEDTKRHVCLLSLKQYGWYFFLKRKRHIFIYNQEQLF